MEILATWIGSDGALCLSGFVVALLVAAITTEPVRRIAQRIGAVDVPGGRRMHARPTARLGGVAVCIALVATISALLFIDPNLGSTEARHRATWTVFCAVLVCLLGVIDDTRGTRPREKLLGLFLAAACLAVAGIRIDNVSIPGLGQFELGWLAVPVTIFWIAGCANAVNLIDGVDGGSSSVVLTSSLVLAAVAVGVGELVPALVFATIGGSCAGFLFHNRQPARIFLGDSGSLMLGFVLAATAATCCAKRATAIMLGAALLALAVPLFDTTHSFVRRFRSALDPRRKRWLRRALRATVVADRGHLHHRLLQHGCSHRQVARVMTLVTAATGLCALLLLPTGQANSVWLWVAAGAALVLFLRIGLIPAPRTESRESPQREPRVLLPPPPAIFRPGRARRLAARRRLRAEGKLPTTSVTGDHATKESE